ncbi:MAG: hypothetical protein A6F72_00070 [Cycloclasticus sp. symbiont of Poecilosclerida sp. N]|nr:MAG: hypothetical protein A6F72_00070 [Cycloclasticus sp. symbiont of Poecilosclerida sp. N]
MEIEAIDEEHWRDVNELTVWQAAFAMNNLEPWDEPISANAEIPEVVEKMRATLLANIAHYETGQVFAPSGWSCKTQRPVQLFGLYFSQQALREWVEERNEEKPLFLVG